MSALAFLISSFDINPSFSAKPKHSLTLPMSSQYVLHSDSEVQPPGPVFEMSFTFSADFSLESPYFTANTLHSFAWLNSSQYTLHSSSDPQLPSSEIGNWISKGFAAYTYNAAPKTIAKETTIIVFCATCILLSERINLYFFKRICRNI